MNIMEQSDREAAPAGSPDLPLLCGGVSLDDPWSDLWRVILIKLLIMFGVLKLFFFPDFLNTNFATDAQRAEYVLEQITQPAQGRNP